MTLDLTDAYTANHYPEGVVTRPVHLGGAVSVEAGVSLTVHVVTESSRALIHRESGWRMEKKPFSAVSPLASELVWWETACTDRSGEYLDAETRQVIVLEDDEHTHLYTTTLTVYAGTDLVGEYTVGPYPVPTGDRSTFDIDTQLIPDGTAEGTLVAIPDIWAQIVADAQVVAGMKGLPDGIAELDASGVVPDVQLPERLSADVMDASFVRRGEIVVSVKEYGAVGDGVADDSGAIQTAIDAVAGFGGGTVTFPLGIYRLVSTLFLRSRVNLRGAGTGTVLRSHEGLNRLIVGEGSLSAAIPLGATATSGEVSISTATPHGFFIGDRVLLTSQRNAMSADAGEDWRLGTAGSGGSVYAYFGEFASVRGVTSPTTLTLGGPLIYPSYRPDRIEDPDTRARDSADVRKVSFLEDVTISDFAIDAAVSGTELIYANMARNVQVRDVSWNGASDSAFVKFRLSLDCEAADLKAEYSYATTPPNIYSRNAYVTASTQDCGFVRCATDNATQGFDMTVSNGSIVNTNSYMRECVSKNSTVDGITIHAGSFATVVERCTVVGCNGNGITTRSRLSRIVGNIVAGKYDFDGSASGSSGIYVFEAFTRDVQVTGNRVTGFRNGVRVYSPASIGADFTWIGARISENIIVGYNIGVLVERQATNKHTGQTGLTIDGNLFRKPFVSAIAGAGWAVLIPGYVKGAKVTRNDIYGDGSASAAGGIKFAANTDEFYIEGNTVRSHGPVPILVEKPTDSAYIASLVAQGYYGPNRVAGGASDVKDAIADITSRPMLSLVPYQANVVGLGSSVRRYVEVWTDNGMVLKSPNGTSYRLAVSNTGTLSATAM